MSKVKSRAQIEMRDTEDMTREQMEEYMLSRDYITPELAARYLGGFNSAQGVRIQIRSGTLPIAQYHLDSSIRISPERTIKFKKGELGLDEQKLMMILERVFEKIPEKMAAATVEAVRMELHKEI